MDRFISFLKKSFLKSLLGPTDDDDRSRNQNVTVTVARTINIDRTNEEKKYVRSSHGNQPSLKNNVPTSASIMLEESLSESTTTATHFTASGGMPSENPAPIVESKKRTRSLNSHDYRMSCASDDNENSTSLNIRGHYEDSEDFVDHPSMANIVDYASSAVDDRNDIQDKTNLINPDQNHSTSSTIIFPFSKKTKITKNNTALARSIMPEPPLQSEQNCMANVDVTSTPSLCAHLEAPSFCPSMLLNLLPMEVLQYALSYIAIEPPDRFAILQTCKLFHVLANSVDIIQQLNLFFNNGAILYECSSSSSLSTSECTNCNTTISIDMHDASSAVMLSPSRAIQKLLPYGRCGNRQALYMIGMIRTYCHDPSTSSFQSGISILHYASKLGCARSSYSLGLILRDYCKTSSRALLNEACEQQYLPACQEILTANEIRDRFGDLDAITLETYMDPEGLSRLLNQFYLNSIDVRVAQTSHCWNPLCGRWAFKATTTSNTPVAANARNTTSTSATGNLIANRFVGSNILGNGNYQHHQAQDDDIPLYRLLSSNRETNSQHLSPNPRYFSEKSSLCYQSRDMSSSSIDLALDNLLLYPQLNGYCSPFAAAYFATPSSQSSDSKTSAADAYSSCFVMSSKADTNASWSSIYNKSQNNESSEDFVEDIGRRTKVSRMKMCSSCRRAKYCSKLCQVYDWRSGKHRSECHYLVGL